VFYPISTLPHWMQMLARVLPPSYVFEGMRGIVAGKGVIWGDLYVGAGLAVLYVLVAAWYFASTYRSAVRTGLIARYSAETVS
jgi:ABC-2 type transport system permease protein